MDQTQAPVQSCPDCAAQMPAAVRFCPGCGRSMQIIARAQGKVGVLSENVAGALAYFTILPAILFLFLEPYRRNLFIRFQGLYALSVFLQLVVTRWIRPYPDFILQRDPHFRLQS